MAVCLICLWIQAINHGRDFSHWLSYVPLAILLNWGVSLTYPLMLPLLYAPLAAYLTTRAWHEKSPRLFWHGAASIALSIVVGVGLSLSGPRPC